MIEFLTWPQAHLHLLTNIFTYAQFDVVSLILCCRDGEERDTLCVCSQVDPASSVGVQELIDEIKSKSYLPLRDLSRPTVFAVDHCFSIRGQGTVMTGTVLQGRINVNDVSSSNCSTAFAHVTCYCS